jgi:hypothetical protein
MADEPTTTLRLTAGELKIMLTALLDHVDSVSEQNGDTQEVYEVTARVRRGTVRLHQRRPESDRVEERRQQEQVVAAVLSPETGPGAMMHGPAPSPATPAHTGVTSPPGSGTRTNTPNCPATTCRPEISRSRCSAATLPRCGSAPAGPVATT